MVHSASERYRLLQQGLRRDDADHVVQPVAAHRVARMLFVGDHPEHVVGRAGGVEPDDLGVAGPAEGRLFA
jgi:hypothetical protein